jgi:CheY-like chemotaxis protein
MRTPPSLADIQASSPNLILLDLLFNGQQVGWSLLEAIRDDPSTTTIPIIVCTAIPYPESLVRPAGYDPEITFLTKPFELDEVIATVSAVAQPLLPAPSQDRHADIGPTRESRSVMNS